MRQTRLGPDLSIVRLIIYNDFHLITRRSPQQIGLVPLRCDFMTPLTVYVVITQYAQGRQK